MLGWEELPGLGKDSLLDKGLRQLTKIIMSVWSSGIKQLPSCSPAIISSGDTWKCPGPLWFVLRSESTDGGPDVEDFGMYSRRAMGSLNCRQGTNWC